MRPDGCLISQSSANDKAALPTRPHHFDLAVEGLVANKMPRKHDPILQPI
jgi:hypothetical protein